ncbi:MAG: hypothetical protein ONA90_00800 [candidate division KSB1 bacterium]|nr:hypothetical protein [candidate division KSB1 bacterium]
MSVMAVVVIAVSGSSYESNVFKYVEIRVIKVDAGVDNGDVTVYPLIRTVDVRFRIQVGIDTVDAGG